jgi:hypothetical protein
MFLCKTRELLIGNKVFARFEEDQLHPITGPLLTLKKTARSLWKLQTNAHFTQGVKAKVQLKSKHSYWCES